MNMLPTAAPACRRAQERVPLPVELEIELPHGAVRAIVRDVSYRHGDDDLPCGVCILHHAPLPDTTLRCRTLEATPGMPSEFQLAVRWTRCFEHEAWLSGGEILTMEASSPASASSRRPS
jgi:hypothetical protein